MSVATARTLVLRFVVAITVVVVGVFVSAGRALAQGVTTAAVRGTVTDEQGQPVPTATLMLVGTQTGGRYQAITQTSGRFFIANVEVGSYTIEARAIGFRPVRQALQLSLGQVADVTIRMQATAVEVQAITTVAEAGTPLLSASRTGAGSTVTERLIGSLPSLNRDFTDFIQTVPQVNGNSIAGGTNRSNNIQIDGAVNNDLFSLNSSNGLPGGRSNARPVSLEAIKEFQVQIAPYDVRYGGFTGGLINAITRSGTNQWSGSFYGYVRSQALVGRDSLGFEAADFTNNQYGFTIGGPIVRDRLHFFVAGDVRKDNRPFSLLQIGSDTTAGKDSVGIGIRLATALAVQRIARDSLGFDPGDPFNPTNTNPNKNIFVKLNAQLTPNSQIEASFNRVSASINTLFHSSTSTGFRDAYELSNSGYNFKTDITSFRARWNAPIGSRLTNELIVGRSAYREPRAIANRVPDIFVGGDRPFTGITPSTNIDIGAERFSHQNILNQDIYELSDNLTAALGSHVFTFGTHNEFFTFFNAFFPASNGIWGFRDTLALLRKRAYHYEIALPLIPGGPNVNWKVRQWGFYAQDVWSPVRRLNLTVGLRLDMPRLDQPIYNHTLDSVTAGASAYVNSACVSPTACGGINTTTVPRQFLWSPRFGFNYDARGDGSSFFRGGIGVFSGRPPYVFVSNAYSNTGASQAQLVCDSTATSSNVPIFTVDVDNQPQTCLAGAAPAPPTPSVVYMDPDLKFPQNLRVSLGVDQRLPWNVVGTVDLLYGRMINQFYQTDVNLIPGGTSFGEDNRPLYGTISSSGTNTARRRWTIANDVIGISNANRDSYWSATFQLQKRFSNRLELTASYTRAQTKDLVSFGSDIANSNLRFSPLYGTLTDRILTTSRFDVPHKVTVTATAELPYGVGLSVQYYGRSGQPFTYMVSTDINADGLSGNDPVYVPVNAQDISLSNPSQWTLLDNFIKSQPCLDTQRGHLMVRNSCRDPWQTLFNARLAKTFRTVRGQSVQLTADFINVLSLLHLGGEDKTTSGGFEAVNMLTRAGYSSTLGRGIYGLALPTLNRVSNFNSRYQIMIGLKYNF